MRNKHIGSSFSDFLEEEGIKDEVEIGALKEVIADALRFQMRKKKISKARMARMMKTSRTSLDRLLDQRSHSVTLITLARAAKAVGADLHISLV